MTDTNKTPDNMTSAELANALKAGTVGGTTPDANGNVKAKKIAKTKASKPAKKPAAKKTTKPAKKPAKAKASKKPAKKPAKASKARDSQVTITAEFLKSLKKPTSAIEIAKKMKVRPVEVHRAVARLEGEGYTVTATRAAPTGKPGRRAFLFLVTGKGGK